MRTYLILSLLFACMVFVLPAFSQESAGRHGERTEEKGGEIRRIEPPEKGFYSKVLDYEGIPIKAHEVVADKALFVARERLARMFKNLPDARYNLKVAGAELHII